MEHQLALEWRNKLAPKLTQIPGVNGVRISRSGGLLVELERSSETISERIMDLMEREGADHIPYTTKVVGRVVRIA